jgi:hypothetical protein
LVFSFEVVGSVCNATPTGKFNSRQGQGGSEFEDDVVPQGLVLAKEPLQEPEAVGQFREVAVSEDAATTAH